MNWWMIIIICAAALLTAFLVYIYRFEPVNFGLTDIRINISDGPASDKGKKLFTILHLSDFHLRKSFKGRRLFDFIKTLNEEYDFIFITGDMVENTQMSDYLIEMLSHLKARYGKYGVPGVHDYYHKAFYEFAKNMFKRKRTYSAANDIKILREKLADIGIELLSNESRILKIDGKVIEIIGLDDPVIEKLDLGRAFEAIDPIKKDEIVDDSNYNEVKNELFSINNTNMHMLNKKGHLRMALSHTPDSHILAALYKKDVDIVFCGHTHGGQVRLPLIGAIISGCRIKTVFASGLFYFKKIVLFTTRGLGEGRYSQFRCYCPPEAVRISIYG